jgi:transcriptional regulator with XRE-family HTH domain
MATADQRHAFGERLAVLRTAAGLSQRAIGETLAEHDGTAVSGSAYSEWERGISSPSPENVRALERIFDEPEGALAGLLGLRGDDPSTDARITTLERQMAELLDLVRRLGSTPGEHG